MKLPHSQDLVEKAQADAAKELTQRTHGAATIQVTIPLTKPWKRMQEKKPSLESSCEFWLPMVWPQHPGAAPVIYAWERCGSCVEACMEQLIGSRSQMHDHKWWRISNSVEGYYNKTSEEQRPGWPAHVHKLNPKQNKIIPWEPVNTATTRPGLITLCSFLRIHLTHQTIQ